MAELVSISLSINENPIAWTTSTEFTVIATYSDGRTRNITDSCTYTIPSGTTTTTEGIVSIANNIIEINNIELWHGSHTWHGSDMW